MSKIVGSLKEALIRAGLESGMCISFHHHLRNGDRVMNAVLNAAADMGVKNLKLEASSIFDVHEPLIDHIRAGVITEIGTDYMGAKVGRAISEGLLDSPVRFRSHGGRPAAIKRGDIKIDIAFIAAPSSDCEGNINGIYGSSACGSLGYAVSDAAFAKYVIVVTDNIVKYPLSPASIQETDVDSVVLTDSIGEASGIVSGTTKITRDPVGLRIAQLAAKVVEHSGYLKDGFSFQTGAGGASLAVTEYIKPIMKARNIKGGFGLGGITGYMVDMLNEGYFEKLMDVQCFDLKAVESLRNNPNHIEISAERYASPEAKTSCVDHLDCVILGATQVDTDFNVNVHTDSNGYIMGGSGGHCDTAAGAKLAIIAAPLTRARLPLITDRVMCVSTPGSTVDVIVTQRGIAVNPARHDLTERLKANKLPIFDILELKELAEDISGKPAPVETGDRRVADIEYRDGTVIDHIMNASPYEP